MSEKPTFYLKTHSSPLFKHLNTLKTTNRFNTAKTLRTPTRKKKYGKRRNLSGHHHRTCSTRRTTPNQPRLDSTRPSKPSSHQLCKPTRLHRSQPQLPKLPNTTRRMRPRLPPISATKHHDTKHTNLLLPTPLVKLQKNIRRNTIPVNFLETNRFSFSSNGSL